MRTGWLVANVVFGSGVLLNCSVDSMPDPPVAGGRGGTAGSGRGGGGAIGRGGASGGIAAGSAGKPASGVSGAAAGAGKDGTAGVGANSSGGAPPEVGDAGSGGSDPGAEGGEGQGGTASGGTASGGTASGAVGKGGVAGSAGKGATGESGKAGAAGTPGSGGAGGTAGKASAGGSPGKGGTLGSGGSEAKGGSGGAGGAPGWCASQAAPSGVLSADYQCVDFEPGLPPTSTWKGAAVPNEGKATLSTTRASSPTHSLSSLLLSETEFGKADDASLTWSVVGSTAISSVSLRAEINPSSWAGVIAPWTGSIDLLCVRFGSGDTCLSYTQGRDTFFAAAYTGYFLTHAYTGGPAYLDECQVTGTLAANLWNTVELRVTSATGALQVFINGTSSAACQGSFLADTTAEVRVGLQAQPTTTPSWTVYYDNVRASVSR